MAINQKLTDKDELLEAANDDKLYIVDVSDTTSSAEGTGKWIEKGNLNLEAEFLNLGDVDETTFVGKEGQVPVVTANLSTEPVTRSLKFQRLPTFQDLLGGNAIIRGGVINRSNLLYNVWASSYIINNRFYDTIISTDVTLSNGNATLPRIDVFVIEVTTDEPPVPSVVVIEGTPAANPVKPSIDLSTQVEVSFVNVSANATADPTLITEKIYDEGTGEPTEWAVTDTPLGANLLSTVLPKVGTYCMLFPAYTTDVLEFTNDSQVTYIAENSLIFYMKIASGITSASSLQFRLKNGTQYYNFNSTISELINYGFSTVVTDWQLVQIPLSVFVPNSRSITSYSSLEIRFTETPVINMDWLGVQMSNEVTDTLTEIKYTTVTVSVNGDTDYIGRNAIQDAVNSITDASYYNRYIIKVSNGFYYILNSSEYKGSPPSLVSLKDYISIDGESERGVILHAELPPDDIDIDTAIDRIQHQTIANNSIYSDVTNMTIVGKNIRYTIHEDYLTSANGPRTYANLKVIFEGLLGYFTAFGMGTYTGQTVYMKNVKVVSSLFTWSCHNNTKFEKPSRYFVSECDFFSQQKNGNYDSFTVDNDGSIIEVEYNFVNNNLPEWFDYDERWLLANPALGQTYFNHAESRITGSGNTPILFANKCKGDSLRVTTKTVGDAGSVFFDETCTAFDDLIKDRFSELGNPILSERNYYITNGYYVFEGSTGVKSFAFGCVDLSELVAIDDVVNYRSMGKRLGNCSVTAKTLTIIIDGVNYDVVFNSDYTAVTNAVILAEIQAVITAVADVSLYNYSAEYYHEFTDCVETVLNGTAAMLPKGTVVNVDNDVATLSNEWNSTTRILLDDIPIEKAGAVATSYGTGRALKRGIIYAVNTVAHYVRVSTPLLEGNLVNPVNGVLTPTPNGIVRVGKFGLIKIDSNIKTLGLPQNVYVFADLPTPTAGLKAFVSDSSQSNSGPNQGSIVLGGGANFIPVYADGTNWRIG